MKEILFLAHRIPYPPNKGDKIRSYHVLRYLAGNYRVHLGAFVDDPDDWRHAAELERLCGEICLLALHPRWARVRGVRGLWQGLPLTLPYYRDAGMVGWVRNLLARQPISAVFVFSSAMAQYAAPFTAGPRIIDFVDVDSDKWRQYSENKAWPASWIYRREAEYLLRFERETAMAFDHSVFVSEHEANLFRTLAPESGEKTIAIRNGVDTDFFVDAEDYPNPYPEGEEAMVFTGAMDYWANVDAVRWFALNVFPCVQERCPAARFYVVGARPAEAVQDLARISGVKVTGAVVDIRPYLKHARVAVAPLRIARGVQNKVLEAMAMARPVVASPAAMEGLDVADGLDLAVADNPDDWIGTLLSLLAENGMPGISAKNRDFVLHHYGWERNLGYLRPLLPCN